MQDINIRDIASSGDILKLKNKSGKVIKEIELMKCTVSILTKIYLEFKTDKNPNGTQVFLDRFTNVDPVACLKVIYFLIKDKSEYPNFNDFAIDVEEASNSYVEYHTLLAGILNRDLGASNTSRKKKLFKKVIIALIGLLCMTSLLTSIKYLLPILGN